MEESNFIIRREVALGHRKPRGLLPGTVARRVGACWERRPRAGPSKWGYQHTCPDAPTPACSAGLWPALPVRLLLRSPAEHQCPPVAPATEPPEEVARASAGKGQENGPRKPGGGRRGFLAGPLVAWSGGSRKPGKPGKPGSSPFVRAREQATFHQATPCPSIRQIYSVRSARGQSRRGRRRPRRAVLPRGERGGRRHTPNPSRRGRRRYKKDSPAVSPSRQVGLGVWLLQPASPRSHVPAPARFVLPIRQQDQGTPVLQAGGCRRMPTVLPTNSWPL